MSAGALASGAAPARGTEAARRRIPLSVKLAAALIGLVTLVLLINGAVNLWLNYGEAKRAAVGVQQEKARAAAERVNEFVSEIENQIGWTTRAEWRRVPLEQQRYDFIRLLRQAPAVTEVSYLDPSGKEQLKVSRLEPDTVGSGKDLSGELRFKQAVTDKVWFGPVYFRRGSEPYITVAIAHAGRNPGVTTAEVNLKLVWDVITAIKVGEKGFAFVTTAAGRLIAHPDLSLVLRDTDLSRLPQVAPALPAPGGGAAGTAAPASESETTTDLGGNAVLSAHATIGRVGWLVFVQSPVTEALAPVYRSLVQIAALLGLGLLLATVAGTFLARRMVVPIRHLQEGAERLGGGDLSQRIAIRTGDEIETLADRFNQMAGRIQESYETLEAKVEERTREVQQALEYQTATSDVLNVISRSPNDLQPVLDAIVATAARLCDANRTIMRLRDGETYPVAADFGFDPDERAHLLGYSGVPAHGSIWGRAILQGKAVHVPDTLADAAFERRDAPRAMGVRSGIGVPMVRDGEPIGVLTVTREAARAFTPQQIALLGTFADQAVIAIGNARLFEEVQARTKEVTEALQQQTATSGVLQAISRSTFDLETVLDTLVHSAASLCQSDIGTITRQRDGVFYRAAIYGFPEDFAREAATIPVDISDGTVTGRALKDGRIVHIPDVLSDAKYTWTEGQEAAGYRTLLGVPLLREGNPIGAFALGRREVRPYTERQIELVKTFADQAVIAIENARLFEEVQARTAELQASLDDLRKAQDRLVQSEKLASLGQLTAGIAHEIKNPLNFVNNFSSLSADLIDELNEVLGPAMLDDKTRAEVGELTGMLKGNLEKVVSHGKRADSIVKNMLLHSREGSGDHRMVDVNALVEESMNLAYHGARAEKPGFNVTLAKELDPVAGQADLYPQEITRVLLNLIGNGFYAATKRKADMDGSFEPTMKAMTRDLGDRVEIKIRDNGTGIPEDVRAKMFNPFFTTKPAGEGTGLGLSLSHDIIVKQHGGTIEVATEPGAFTEFTIVLPRNGAVAKTGMPDGGS